MRIGDRSISAGDDAIFFIAEIGLCHNGCVDDALRLIDVAAASGANAVKFQKRTVERLATPEVLDAPDARFPSLGRTYREIRERVEFGATEFDAIFEHAARRRIPCFVTPFDVEALDFLDTYPVPAYKLASHSVTDVPLLRATAGKGKPVILSTGMASTDEIDAAVEILRGAGVELALLHCVSSYPTELAQANLRAMDTLHRRYGGIVGFSGHETDNVITLAAAARGARIIERHITLAHDQEGFDHSIALDPEELGEVIAQIRKIECVLGSGSKAVTDSERITRDKYRRSIATRRDIRPGEVLSDAELVLLNPGTGMHPRELPRVIGRRARTFIPRGTLLRPEML